MSLELRWPVPQGWGWTSIENIADVTGGGTPSANDPLNFSDEGGIPWVTPADLTGYANTYIKRGRRNLSERGYKNSAAKLLPAGAVLFTSRAPIGYCAIAANPIATNQGFKSLTLFGGISAEFTRHYLKWSKPFLESLASGTTFLELSGSKLQQVPFPLPPVSEQKRIVAKLDVLNAKSARARTELARIETLVSRYKQAVLSKAFSGELGRKDLGELVARIKAGKNLRCEERPPHSQEKGVVKVSAVTWGEFRADQSKTLPPDFEPDQDTRIKSGDFLFSRANTVDLVGAVVIVADAPDNLYLSDKILRLEFSEPVDAWLLWYLRSPMGREALMNISSGNQLSMRNIGQKSLLSLSIPYADAELRNDIVRSIESAFAKIDRLAGQVKRAQELVGRLDEAILAKAFRGELVPQDENDEPARLLLERIRTEREAAPKVKSQRIKRETTMPTARDFLNTKLENWPAEGISFQDLRREFGGSYEDLKEAVFASLSDEQPALQQVFNEKTSMMTIRKRA